MVKAEELESMITNELMNGDRSSFVKQLKALKVKPAEIASMDLFGDSELSEKVSEVKAQLDSGKNPDKALDKVMSYLKVISKSTHFSENEFEGNSMITDREINEVSAENVGKINEKVINMEETLDNVQNKLNSLVQQQKDLMGAIDPESTKTTEEKLDDVKEDVKDLTEAFSYLCDYINYAEEAQAMDPAMAGGAPMAAPQTPAYVDGYNTGKGGAADPSANLAAQLGYQPGTQPYEDFMKGYQAAMVGMQGQPAMPAGGMDPMAAQVGDPATAGAMAPQGMPPAGAPQQFSAMDGITYSEAHDAWFSQSGDIYMYNADRDCYVNQDNEKLMFSQENNVYYSEELEPEMKYVTTVFSAEDGTAKDLYSTEGNATLFSEDGESMVYNANQDAFFSEYGDTYFDEDAYFSNGCDLEVTEADNEGNCICHSDVTDQWYYYSADEGILFSEDEIEEAADDDDDIEVVHVNADDKTIIVIDNDHDLDVKDEGDKVVIEDEDSGDSDQLTIEEKDDDGDAICCSDVTGKYYLYSATDKVFYPEETLAMFSEQMNNGNVDSDSTNFSEMGTYEQFSQDGAINTFSKLDNRSSGAITLQNFCENTQMVDFSNAQARYDALQSYLKNPEEQVLF